MDLIGNFPFEKLSSFEIRFTRLQNGQTRPDSSGLGLDAGFGGFYYRCRSGHTLGNGFGRPAEPCESKPSGPKPSAK